MTCTHMLEKPSNRVQIKTINKSTFNEFAKVDLVKEVTSIYG